MGADLYIEKIHNENEEKTKPIFEAALKARDEFYAKNDLGADTDAAKELRRRGMLKLFGPDVGAAMSGQPEIKLSADIEAIVAQAERLQQEVEDAHNAMYAVGYFRDSYNDSSLLRNLGLSWWKHVGALLEEQEDSESGNLQVEGVKKLLKMVEERQVDRAGCDDDEAYEYFVKKRGIFLAFLKQAIELNEPIYCSI